jgi:hypothetical protein
MTQAQAAPLGGFIVVYRPADGLILGVDPRGGAVGPDHRVAHISDLSQYELLLKTDPAYLSVDGESIMNVPRSV